MNYQEILFETLTALLLFVFEKCFEPSISFVVLNIVVFAINVVAFAEESSLVKNNERDKDKMLKLYFKQKLQKLKEIKSLILKGSHKKILYLQMGMI